MDSKCEYISKAEHEKKFEDSVERVAVNPFVESTLSVSAGCSLILYDIEAQKVLIGMWLLAFICIICFYLNMIYYLDYIRK